MKIQLNKILWAYAFLIVGLAYAFGLFIDLTGDSGLYAAISRQMVESGDWFNLKINGEPYDQKPHLFFWLAGIGIQLFGNTNFAFKLFPFLYGFVGIYFTYRLGKQLFSDKVGKFAALITGTSQIYFLYFFDFHTDTVLQTGVVFALWQLTAYLQNKKSLHFILGFLGIGLAMLSKGPVGAILPFFAVLLFLLGTKDLRQLFHPKWILGIFLVLIVISPSLFHLYKSFGLEGLKFYFITNNIGRITGEYAGSSTDSFFYITTVLWAFLPWTITILISVFNEIKSWFNLNNKPNWGVYLLGSVLILILILSVAKGKAPNYFLITIPVISVVAAKWITRIPQLAIKTQKSIIVSQYIVVAFLGVFMVLLIFIHLEYKIPLILFLLTTVVLILFFRLQKDKLKRLLFASVLFAGTINLFLNAVVVPKLFAFQGARQALEIYERQRDENDILINLHLEEYELFYYANSMVQDFTNWEDFYDLFNKKGTWIYTNKEGYNGIMDLKVNLNTIYVIQSKGMNDLSFQFLNPATRKSTLNKAYLIKIH